ncbi:MAG TPA: hypothetical protein VJQ09_00510 [Candidatus Limnocylindria bacterium]|nr:hypothetical protein [Candidatus Limnocylindria bacterium]
MSDRSFVRFGGLAGILLAITSWSAVVAYFTVAQGGQDVVGTQIYQFLYALIALWAMFGIVAVYWVARAQGEAWAFFATLVGVVAAFGTMTAAVWQIAVARAVLLAPVTTPAPLPLVAATDPLNLATYGLTGLWFLIANILLWRARFPRLLVALGFVAVADLVAGLLASLAGNTNVVNLTGIVAGAVGGPLYWLWLGLRLRRAE